MTDPQAVRYDWFVTQAEWHDNMRFCDLKWHDSQRRWYIAQARKSDTLTDLTTRTLQKHVVCVMTNITRNNALFQQIQAPAEP